jgi:hypothetical protein
MKMSEAVSEKEGRPIRWYGARPYNNELGASLVCGRDKKDHDDFTR